MKGAPHSGRGYSGKGSLGYRRTMGPSGARVRVLTRLVHVGRALETLTRGHDKRVAEGLVAAGLAEVQDSEFGPCFAATAAGREWLAKARGDAPPPAADQGAAARTLTVLAVVEVSSVVRERSDEDLLSDAQKILGTWATHDDSGRFGACVAFCSVERGASPAARLAGFDESVLEGWSS